MSNKREIFVPIVITFNRIVKEGKTTKRLNIIKGLKWLFQQFIETRTVGKEVEPVSQAYFTIGKNGGWKTISPKKYFHYNKKFIGLSINMEGTNV